MRLVLVLGLVLGLAPADAQQALTLREAARIALESHPAIEAAEAGALQSEASIRVAKAGALPRLSWAESYTRSNNPVFAFGTLLNQKRFSEADFDVRRLNNPASIQNFQSLFQVEQVVFDAKRTRRAIDSARLTQQLSDEERRLRELDVMLGVVRTYFGVSLTQESLALAEDRFRSADADLRRTQTMFSAGMATKADVLSVETHRAGVVQQRIRASNDLEVARAALNEALGLDLDTRRDLTTVLAEAPALERELTGYTAEALGAHPQLRTAELQGELAASVTRTAKSELWPKIVARGAFEVDRGRFVTQGGGNWLASVGMHWDLWKGSENRARITVARHAEERAAALERQAQAAAALRVRQAWFSLRSADERLVVATSAVSQARESRRIVENRYEAGLEGVTELLRGETALAGARFSRLAALYEQRVARAELEHAAGLLNVSSEALE